MENKVKIRKNIFSIFIILALGLITYGIKLFTYSFSIDTEAFLYNKDEILKSWISISRYGLVFLKKVLDLASFNLILANWIGFALLFISILVCIFNINMITKRNNYIANILLGGIIITSPIIVEQFNFTLQCVEISFSLLLLNFAFTIINWCIINKKEYYLLIFSIIFIVVSFSSYQAFFPLMITFSTYFILLLFRERNENKINIILKYIFIFVVGVILYKIIDSIVIKITGINPTPYLNGQILWGSDRKITIIKTIIKNIMKLLLGVGREHYNLGLLFCILGLIPFIIKNLKFENWVFHISLITFIISPFLLIMITGGEPTARTLFSYTFTTALGAYFIYNYTNKKIFKIIVISLFSSIIIYQIFISAELFYTDYNVFKKESQIAKEIEEKLKIINTEDKPIAFVGPLSIDGDKIILKGEVMGWSFFEWDQGTVMDSNIRICGFLKQLGYSNSFVSKEQYQNAKEKAKCIPCYPNDGYINNQDDYLIIKLNN